MIGQAAEIPLGISEAYDLLPPEGNKLNVRCQDCDEIFIDQMRKISTGSSVLAVFCPPCRSCRRLHLAAPLPTVRTLQRCKGGSIIMNVLHPRRSRE
jgi:hypothetical protein